MTVNELIEALREVGAEHGGDCLVAAKLNWAFTKRGSFGTPSGIEVLHVDDMPTNTVMVLLTGQLVSNYED